MKTYKHKTQSTRNAQLTYYSIIKNLLKSILFGDERKKWRERKSSLSSGRLPHIYNTTCKEMFPNIDAAMIYVQFIWMTTS